MKDIHIEDKLCTFIKDFGEDLCSLELLVFFSRHPNARFNRTAVLHAPLTSGKFDTALTLKRLIERKMVVTCFENGITLYALTKEEPVHTLAAQLINIDQGQWQVIVGKILDDQDL